MADGSKNTTIIANIEAITKATSKLASGSKEAASAAKLLAQEYELGIGNASTVKVFEQYQTAIDKVNKNIEEYQKNIQQLTADRDSLNDIEGENSKLYNQLTNKIASLNNALKKEREQLIALTAEQKKYSTQTIATAEAEKKAAEQAEKQAVANKKLQARQQELNKIVKAGIRIFTALIYAYKKMISASMEQGTELYSLSKRYGATAEEIQKMNRALQLATGQSDLFTNSLAVLAKGMSDIAGGRGQKYTKALKAIGLSYKELSEQTKSEQFQSIIEGLMAIENESVRTSHAQTLLGESGQYIVGAFEESGESLNSYLEQAKQFSYITDDNAKRLAELGFGVEAANSQIKLAEAELTISAAPIIKDIMGLLSYGVMPTLKGVTQNSWLLYGAIGTLLTLKVTSTIASWVIQIRTAEAATRSATIAAVTFKAVMGGLVISLGAAALSMGISGIQAKKMKEEMEAAANAAQQLSAQSGNFNTNIENYSTQSTEKTVTMNIDLYGHGDTVASDESAQTIAQLTAEQVNRELGILAKDN